MCVSLCFLPRSPCRLLLSCGVRVGYKTKNPTETGFRLGCRVERCTTIFSSFDEAYLSRDSPFVVNYRWVTNPPDIEIIHEQMQYLIDFIYTNLKTNRNNYCKIRICPNVLVSNNVYNSRHGTNATTFLEATWLTLLS